MPFKVPERIEFRIVANVYTSFSEVTNMGVNILLNTSSKKKIQMTNYKWILVN